MQLVMFEEPEYTWYYDSLGTWFWQFDGTWLQKNTEKVSLVHPSELENLDL